MTFITVNFIWKLLKCMWTLVMQCEWSALQWTLYGKYFTAGGHWYCCLNEVHYSEHYMESTSKYVDIGIAIWIKCNTVNIIWKILHSRWTLPLQFQWSALHLTLYGRYFTVCDTGIAVWMTCIRVSIIWKLIHSMWTLVLQFELSALQWTLYRSYFTVCGHWYCCLNEVHYSEH